jgi:hypothetical protein
MESFKTCKKHTKYLLIMVDASTTYTIIEPIKNLKTRDTIKVLLYLMCLFGVPTRIISDTRPSFTSYGFKIYRDTYGIKRVVTGVAMSRSNKQCRQYNKTVVDALVTIAATKVPQHWNLEDKKVQIVLNTAHNKGINTTPMRVLMPFDERTVGGN